MNIFYLDKFPNTCAKMHADKHVVKMILEYAQLLSTAHRVLDGTETVRLSDSGRKQKRWVLAGDLDSILYSSTHMNHPSAIWVRQSKENYIWLANLLVELCAEYTHRYGKIHKVERDGLCYVLLKNIPKNLGTKGWSEPTPAMPDEVKIAGDSISSYRNYYIKNKQHLASWQGKVNSRNVPSWFIGV
jgi:hypothetical protein